MKDFGTSKLYIRLTACGCLSLVPSVRGNPHKLGTANRKANGTKRLHTQCQLKRVLRGRALAMRRMMRWHKCRKLRVRDEGGKKRGRRDVGVRLMPNAGLLRVQLSSWQPFAAERIRLKLLDCVKEIISYRYGFKQACGHWSMHMSVLRHDAMLIALHVRLIRWIQRSRILTGASFLTLV